MRMVTPVGDERPKPRFTARNKLAEASRLRDGPAMASHPLDAMSAAPDHHGVLFENERVRVLDTKLPAGERTPVHAHEWPAALYVLSWSDFVRRDAEGAILVDSKERGQPGPRARPWLDPLPPQS